MARPSSPRTTQPLCIALVAVAPRGSSSGRRPDLADTPFTLPGSPSLSLPPDRTPPSPPFAIATVSDHPSLPRPAQELRLDSLFLPTAPQLPGSPASPPRRRSPLRAPTTAATVRRSSRLRPPLAPPTSSEAPPQLPPRLPHLASPCLTPPRPTSSTTASDHPSLPRLAQELRLDSLFLPTAPRVPGSPASPPTSPFPSSATGDRRRRFAALRPPPNPLTLPAAPR